MAWLQLQSQFYLETKFLFHQNCLFHYKALRSMTRIPLVPVYPSFLFIFQEEKIIAEIKKWNSKYCILISDSCFQCLYADRKFWSRRYLFPHLCIRISDNTGYPDREFFFLIQEERDSFKELIAKKDQLNRMQRSVAKTFQEVLELTGSLCFMFRSTPRRRSDVLPDGAAGQGEPSHDQRVWCRFTTSSQGEQCHRCLFARSTLTHSSIVASRSQFLTENS